LDIRHHSSGDTSVSDNDNRFDSLDTTGVQSSFGSDEDVRLHKSDTDYDLSDVRGCEFNNEDHTHTKVDLDDLAMDRQHMRDGVNSEVR
jgi:hypothetical protein